jgi:hypothetical protein
MHESILKTLDSFNGPFGFGMGYEAAGQLVLFLAILSMGMAMVSCGLLSSGLLEAKLSEKYACMRAHIHGIFVQHEVSYKDDIIMPTTGDPF